ncbi:MAG: YbfB/YjiJ family MFS transporter, partial [Stellaceae bacterium]
TTLALGRAAQLAPGRAQAAWSVATGAWALGQAAGAYALSALFAASGSHALLFTAGAAAILAALAVDVAVGR